MPRRYPVEFRRKVLDLIEAKRQGCGRLRMEIAGTHNLLKLYRRVLTDPTIAPYSRIAAATTG